MNRKALRGNLLLLLTAMIWGSAFVAQRVGMESVQPFTFNGVRSLLAALVLLPVIRVLDKKGAGRKPGTPEEKRRLAVGGVLCGLCLFGGSTLQQFGLVYTTAGKAGFITALYVVLVPIAALCFGKRARLTTWVGVALAAAGLYLLCMTDALSINRGDVLVMLCAFCFCAHILVIDHFSPGVDGVRLSCLQFFVSGLIATVCALATETIRLDALLECAAPILYAGVLSGGVGYTLQIVAQKDTDPTIASMIMCLESVFSVVFGTILLGEQMSAREGIGCALMFVAIILAQLPERRRS